ncbi:MAG: ankyrin repeat domain-containing protein [Gemmataceae bacterium]
MASPISEFRSALVDSDVDSLNRLLSGGFDVNQRMETGDTPFIAAVRLCSEPFVRRLLESGADLGSQHLRSGDTALHVVCREGMRNRVRLLLEAGADPNALNEFNQSPLSVSLIHAEKKYVPVVHELLRHGADPNEAGYESNLMQAAKESTVDCLRLLLQFNADVNDVRAGGTALIGAIAFKKNKIVEELLKHGADPYLRVPKDSPLERIAGMDAFEVAKLAKNMRALALLQDPGTAAPRSPM